MCLFVSFFPFTKLLFIREGPFRASVWPQTFLRVVGMGTSSLPVSGGVEPWFSERRARWFSCRQCHPRAHIWLPLICQRKTSRAKDRWAVSKDGLGRRNERKSKLLWTKKKSHLEFRGVVCQEQSAIRVVIIIPTCNETMIPSGFRKTKSIVFNDFVPIITLNEQTTFFALLGEKYKPFSWSDV